MIEPIIVVLLAVCSCAISFAIKTGAANANAEWIEMCEQSETTLEENIHAADELRKRSEAME